MKRAASFLVVAMVIAACGGGGGSTGTTTASDSASFVKQYCELVGGTCCPKLGKTYNEASCTALFAIAYGSGTYDPAAGSQCLSALQAQSSSANFCAAPGDDASTNALCRAVYKQSGGGKQPGEPCSNSNECASSPDGDVTCATTFNANNSESKTCRVSLRGKEGDACSGTKTGGVTSYSNNEDPAHITICWDEDQLYCSSTFGGTQTTGKCTKLAAIGADCTGNNINLQCVSGAYCDYTSKKCLADVAVGGDCGGTTNATCAATAYCDTASKKCVQAVPVNGACQTSPQCGSGNTCVNGKCQGYGVSGVIFYCAQ